MKTHNSTILKICLSILFSIAFLGCAQQNMSGDMDAKMGTGMEENMKIMDNAKMEESMQEMPEQKMDDTMEEMKDKEMMK